MAQMNTCSACNQKVGRPDVCPVLSCEGIRQIQTALKDAESMVRYQVQRNKKLECELAALKKELDESRKQHRGYKGQLIKQALERSESEGKKAPGWVHRVGKKKRGGPPDIPAPKKTTLF